MSALRLIVGVPFRQALLKTNLKVIPLAIVLVALLAFPALVKAQKFPGGLTGLPLPPGTVTAITVTPATNHVVFTDLGHGLTIVTLCRDGGQPTSPVGVAFHNSGSDGATINYLYSDGTTVTASGNSLQAVYGELQVFFNNKRIEGQFIFANLGGNTTVNLHAFDGQTFCEVRGTAEWGPNPVFILPPAEQFN
jgi:hypothetical protein